LIIHFIYFFSYRTRLSMPSVQRCGDMRWLWPTNKITVYLWTSWTGKGLVVRLSPLRGRISLWLHPWET
jgi:hypothetical protein